MNVDAQTHDPRVSPKSYVVATAYAAVFGILGVHFFYLGRVGMGLLDLSLSVLGLGLLLGGEPLWGGLILALDFLHSVTVTFRLLVGLEVDGDGRRIIYPGQKLDHQPTWDGRS